MRLWTPHKRYLDAVGLVVLWREALLAQAVKLQRRSPAWYRDRVAGARPTAHPLFRIVPGAVRVWERVNRRESTDM